MHSKFFSFFFNASVSGPAFSSPAFSTPAFSVHHFSVLHFLPCIFGPAFSCPAFSGPAFSGPAFSGHAFFYPGNLVPHFPVVSVALWSKWSLIGLSFSGPAFSVDPAVAAQERDYTYMYYYRISQISTSCVNDKWEGQSLTRPWCFYCNLQTVDLKSIELDLWH